MTLWTRGPLGVGWLSSDGRALRKTHWQLSQIQSGKTPLGIQWDGFTINGILERGWTQSPLGAVDIQMTPLGREAVGVHRSWAASRILFPTVGKYGTSHTNALLLNVGCLWATPTWYNCQHHKCLSTKHDNTTLWHQRCLVPCFFIRPLFPNSSHAPLFAPIILLPPHEDLLLFCWLLTGSPPAVCVAESLLMPLWPSCLQLLGAGLQGDAQSYPAASFQICNDIFFCRFFSLPQFFLPVFFFKFVKNPLEFLKPSKFRNLCHGHHWQLIILTGKSKTKPHGNNNNILFCSLDIMVRSSIFIHFINCFPDLLIYQLTDYHSCCLYQ